LDKQIGKKSKKHYAYFLRGQISFSQKNYKLAEDDFSKAIEISPKEDYIFARSQIYIAMEKYKKSETDLNFLIEKNNYNLEYKYKYALVLLKLSEYEKALIYIDQVCNYFPQNIEYRFLKGEICFLSGDYISALKEFNFCAASVKKSEYFERLADTYFKTSNFEYAVSNYSMCLDLEPDSGEIYFKKANAHFAAGEQETACGLWQKSVNLKYYPASDKTELYCK